MTLLNKVKKLLRLESGQALPTTTGGGGNTNIFATHNYYTANKKDDGSAKSIRIHGTVQEAWERTPVPIQRTYMAAAAFLLSIYLGYRWVRYANAYIHVDCHSTACHFKVQAAGWHKPVQLQVARQQVLQVLPVKTEKDGTLVSDQNVKIDPIASRGSKKKKKQTSSYKGPDENGHYLSYEYILQDRPPPGSAEPENDPNRSQDDELAAAVSLEPLMEYLERSNPDADRHHHHHHRRPGEDEDQPPPPPAIPEYRLIVRQFRLAQSRRRVRSMTSKITSYIKKRRQKITVKESAPPSWQGIVLLVLGIVGFLLSVLLGQLWEDDRPPTYKERRLQMQKERQRQEARLKQRQRGGRVQRVPSSPRRTISRGSASSSAHNAATSSTAGGPGTRRSSTDAPPGYNVVPANSRTAATTRRRF